ncbi:MAG: ABC transporter permease, partial [Spirochaetia bacterium]|nr:ABC transporter permease [Spirochaetia bacterium]
MINRPVFHLMAMQFRVFYREPGILFWAFGFPLAMAWILGIAFSGRASLQEKGAVVVPANVASSVLMNRLRHIDQKDHTYTLVTDGKSGHSIRLAEMREAEAVSALSRGIVLFVLDETADGAVRFRLDPANEQAHFAALLLERTLFLKDRPRVRTVIASISALGARYVDYLVPGLIAMGIMNSCMWGISWALVEFRIKKLLRGMMATPLSKYEFLLSFFLTRWVITLLEAVVMIVFAWLYFGVTVKGSLSAAVLVLTAGNACFAGVAVFASSRAASTQVGNGVINAVTLPMMVLSGIFFSYHNFPDWAAAVVQYFPLTLLADLSRAVFNEGAQ